MWVKVDDSFIDHLKVHRAGQRVGRDGVPRVVTLYLSGLCYSSRNLTDGFLPARVVEGMLHVGAPLKVAEALVGVGLWETTDGGFQIHDYLDYQPASAQVKEKRAKDRGRKARDSTADSSESPRGIAQDSVRNPERPAGRDLDLEKDLKKSAVEKHVADPANAPPSTLLDTAESIRWFDRLYAVYPNKDRKQEACRAWSELSPDLETATAVFSDVQARVKAGWKRFERRFIPQLRNYLTERMWEDEATIAEPVYQDDSLPANHAWNCKKCGGVHEGTLEQEQRRECLREVSA